MNHFEAKQVSVTLGGRQIIKWIDLSFAAGSFVGLIGPNGAGKSTLMRALAGLAPFSGEINISGHAMASMTSNARAHQIAYLAQSRDIAWPVSVEAVVALGRLPHRPAFAGIGVNDRNIIERAIAEMEFQGLRHRSAMELSGGELARVLMARALAQDTGIIIADEPAAGLDPAHQLSLMQLFQRLARSGRTVIVSLHELSLAARWCDRLVLIDHGRVSADGAPKDVLTLESLRGVYGIEAFIGQDPGGLLLIPTDLAACDMHDAAQHGEAVVFSFMRSPNQGSIGGRSLVALLLVRTLPTRFGGPDLRQFRYIGSDLQIRDVKKSIRHAVGVQADVLRPLTEPDRIALQFAYAVHNDRLAWIRRSSPYAVARWSAPIRMTDLLSPAVFPMKSASRESSARRSRHAACVSARAAWRTGTRPDHHAR